MAKKTRKLYCIHVELHSISDYYGETIIKEICPDILKLAVSEKQAIAQLRWSNGWYDYDSVDGSTSYKWIFITKSYIEKINQNEEFKQMSLFDENLKPIQY